MIAYKLTTQDMATHNGFKWTLGKREEITTPGTELCSGDVFHFYDTAELAMLLNPIHGNYDNPRCFRCECNEVAHDGTKGGAKTMALLEEVPLPKITTEQRVAFGIYCTMGVYAEPAWTKWANGWLSGKDRTRDAAAAAYNDIAYAAATAYDDIAYAAATAAYAAAAATDTATGGTAAAAIDTAAAATDAARDIIRRKSTAEARAIMRAAVEKAMKIK